MVSSLSLKKQSVKITQEGIEAFREYYPSNKDFITLECIWKTDKFVLLESTHKCDVNGQDGNLGDATAETLALQYKSIEVFLADNLDVENLNEDCAATEDSTHVREDEKDLFNGNRKEAIGGVDLGDNVVNVGSLDENISPVHGLLATPNSSPTSTPLQPKSSVKSVAFFSVKRPAISAAAFVSVKEPAASTVNVTDLHSDEAKKGNDNKEDSFFNLLIGGNLKDSLFLFF